MNTILESALLYARLGWNIFPLEPGSKRPHGNSEDVTELKRRGQQRHTPHRLAINGHRCATSDSAKIRAWWADDPSAGIGWVPGPAYLVIDVDVKNGKPGMESLASLTAQHGSISTLTSQTPSGGIHIVFRTVTVPAREGNDALGLGLDIRARRGYVVLPPTAIAEGAYEWMNWTTGGAAPRIADAPQWILDRLGSSPGSAGSTSSTLGEDDPTEFDRQATADSVDKRTVGALRDALTHVDADDYGTWIAMGHALASLKLTDFADDAREMWFEWSATSNKFDQSRSESIWKSLKPKRTGYGAVFAEAQRRGWVNPQAGMRPGKRTANEVIEFLRTHSRDKVVDVWADETKHLPPDASKLVIDAVCTLTGLGSRVLQAALNVARTGDAKHRRETKTNSRVDGRLRIEYRPEDFSLMADEIDSAIIETAEPGTYICFANSLCEVSVRQMPGTHFIDDYEKEPPAVPLIVPLDEVGILARAERVGVFFKHGRLEPALMGIPKTVIDIILRKRKHRAPQVAGLVTHPIVLPSGEIVAANGLHHGSKLFLHGVSVSDTRAYTKLEAIAAIARLRQSVLEGFEFAEPWDSDVALAGLFTAVQRRILDKAPGLVVKAHMQESGKTTLVQRMHVILTGHDLPVYSFPKNDESEVQKRLLSSLMRSPALLCFDNLEDGTTFSSASIAGAMTSPIYTQRILGASRDVDVPTNTLFVLTGNNLALGPDEDSRWLVTGLTSKNSRPGERTFRHPNVVQHALAIREAVLRDVVGVIAGYFQSGERIEIGTRFVQWDQSVRQPLMWSDCGDMRRNFSSNAEQSVKGLALSQLLTMLYAHFENKEFSAAAVANLVGEFWMGDAEEESAQLRDALKTLGARSFGSAGSVGLALAPNVGRVTHITVEGKGVVDVVLKSRLIGGYIKYSVQPVG